MRENDGVAAKAVAADEWRKSRRESDGVFGIMGKKNGWGVVQSQAPAGIEHINK